MPAIPEKLGPRRILMSGAVLLLMSVGVEAQTGSVTLRGRVSETVAISVLPDLTPGQPDMQVVRNGNTAQIFVSGDDSKAPVIRVPLLVRSNSGFKISAVVESTTAKLTQLSVIDVRAKGNLVSPLAVSELKVSQPLDRKLEERTSELRNPLDISNPMLVLTGPRVSLGGTNDSPNNALQITLLIQVTPQPAQRWQARLTLVGSAVSLIQ